MLCLPQITSKTTYFELLKNNNKIKNWSITVEIDPNCNETCLRF